MNEEPGSNYYKDLTGNFFCPACGAKYSTNEFDLVVKKDDGYVVSIQCRKCQLKVMMNVISADAAGMSDITKTDGAITVNDVIDFSLKIKKFNGDFRREFTSVDQN